MTALLCACGCGERTSGKVYRGKPVRFVNTHHTRVPGLVGRPMGITASKADRNREIIRRYRSGETMGSIGKSFGISHQRVDQIVRHRHQAARHAFNKAVRAGKLTPPAVCSECNALGPVEGHHTDYSKPLEVIWLCTVCHRAADYRAKQQRIRDRVSDFAVFTGEVFTAKEAATQLGIPVNRFYELVKRLGVRGVGEGHSVWYRQSDIDRIAGLASRPSTRSRCARGHHLIATNVDAKGNCRACNANSVSRCNGGRVTGHPTVFAMRAALVSAGFTITDTSRHKVAATAGDISLRASRGGPHPWRAAAAVGSRRVASAVISSIPDLTSFLRSTLTKAAA